MEAVVQQSTSGLLQGQTAFITGAGQGNGRAIALGLAAAGARVVVSDLSEDNSRETAALIRESGGESVSYRLEVTDVTACEDVAANVTRDVGDIHILVNNAGIIVRENSQSPVAHELMRKVMDVNLLGTFNATLAFLASLKRTRGSIVNLASIAAFAAQGGSVGYSPSKAAVVMLTASHAVEYAPFGIRVNAIAPGVIETPMTQATRERPEKLAKFMERTPMARVGQPDELIGPVIFLASKMSSYVTGVTLPVDGGFLAV
jgi:NAD(P)-dependent dehydrogenase (short-subunit alcohol dehydrogenase family)